MTTTRYTKAFTLAELLVGLMVTSVILSAVATLAFTLSSASRISDDVIHTQTQVRSVTPRLLDLVRNSRMICARFNGNLVFWKSSSSQDNQIHINEIAYLEYDDVGHSLILHEFVTAANPTVPDALGLPAATPVLAELAKAQTKTTLLQSYLPTGGVRRGAILRECRNVVFLLDEEPPWTRHLVLSFDLQEDGGDRHFEIDATRWVSAAHLISSDGTGLVGDDD